MTEKEEAWRRGNAKIKKALNTRGKFEGISRSKPGRSCRVTYPRRSMENLYSHRLRVIY